MLTAPREAYNRILRRVQVEFARGRAKISELEERS